MEKVVYAKRHSYSRRSGLVLGFHGTDQSVVHDVVLQRRELKPSINHWDWLGHGIYFWEHSVSRAMEFAVSLSKRRNSHIKRPAVLGAVLDLGNCLDLLDYENFDLLRSAYNYVWPFLKTANLEAASEVSGDLKLRYLDCAVLERVHRECQDKNLPSFDSVKAAFWEGNLLYPTAGFREKNHIQICIRNPNCIKGFFIPFK